MSANPTDAASETSALHKRPAPEDGGSVPDDQPEAKRPRIDGAEDHDASRGEDGKPFPPKIYHKKRKCVLLLGFQGTKYQGMQINPGALTIESVLKSAFFDAGLVSESNSSDFKKISFQRCARTDKGVHALGQIVSCKLFQHPDLVEKLNSILPPEIRVFGSRVVSQGFDSKACCEARTYEYSLPTYTLIPSATPYKKGEGSFSETFTKDADFVLSDEQFDQMLQFRVSSETLDRFRSILAMYCGTHYFHNYTAGGQCDNASMRRYIIDFTCSDPFVYRGIEYVKVRVKGQSFILHQIRKMIGFAVCLIRDNGPIEAVAASFFNPKCNLFMVPGMGLVLRECHFDGYFRTRGKNLEPLLLDPFLPAIEEFARPFIYEHIADLELSERHTASWVANLPLLDYDSIIQGSIDRKKKEEDERVQRALAKQQRTAEFLKSNESSSSSSSSTSTPVGSEETASSVSSSAASTDSDQKNGETSNLPSV